MKKIIHLILFLALSTVIIPIILSCDRCQNMYESRNDDKLAEAHYFTAFHLQNVGTNCKLATSWREGKLYYNFIAEPLTTPKGSEFASSLELGFGYPTFILRLMDKAGFEIITIEMNNIARVVDDNDKPIKLQQRDSIECSRSKYQAISDWTVGWRNY